MLLIKEKQFKKEGIDYNKIYKVLQSTRLKATSQFSQKSKLKGLRTQVNKLSNIAKDNNKLKEEAKLALLKKKLDKIILAKLN